MQINILEAKNRLSELVKTAQAGEEVIIANRGEPVVRLVAVVPRKGSRHAKTRVSNSVLAWLEQHPLPTHAQRSSESIAAALAEERGAWD